MRTYWIGQIERVMRPVLENGCKGALTRNMPIENRGKLLAVHNSTHLQAFDWRGLHHDRQLIPVLRHLSTAGVVGLGFVLGGC